jgi:hypothetical protein
MVELDGPGHLHPGGIRIPRRAGRLYSHGVCAELVAQPADPAEPKTPRFRAVRPGAVRLDVLDTVLLLRRSGRPGGSLLSVPSARDAVTTLAPSPMKLRPSLAAAPLSNQNARSESAYSTENAVEGSIQRSTVCRMTRWRIT